MDTSKESPVIISLCTGIRGLERGVERALQRQLTIAAYVEIEAFIDANLIAGMEAGVLDPAPIWTDVKTFPFGRFHNKVHGIIGGYPCQPFSVAGRQKGAEDPRHLWPYIKEGIAAVRPVFCFFENVRGHLNLGYDQVRRELQELGYTVREGIYSAEEVGAPHRRDRLFILAIRNDQLANSGCWNPRSEDKSKRSSNNFTGCGFKTSMANTDNERLQGWISGELPECSGECTARTSSASEKWPARPGQPQDDWEEKRVAEPGMGITINGYNFREDLLRAAGNGVVEQTAELAFKDLLSKF